MGRLHPRLREAFLRGSQCLGRDGPTLRSRISCGSTGWTTISLPVGAVLLQPSPWLQHRECGRGQPSSKRNSYRSLSSPYLIAIQILLLQLSSGLAEPGLFSLVLPGILSQVPAESPPLPRTNPFFPCPSFPRSQGCGFCQERHPCGDRAQGAGLGQGGRGAPDHQAADGKEFLLLPKRLLRAKSDGNKPTRVSPLITTQGKDALPKILFSRSTSSCRKNSSSETWLMRRESW